MANVAGVHVPDLNPVVQRSHPVVVFRVVLTHFGPITHLHTHARAHAHAHTHTHTNVQLHSDLAPRLLPRNNYLSRHLSMSACISHPSTPSPRSVTRVILMFSPEKLRVASFSSMPSRDTERSSPGTHLVKTCLPAHRQAERDRQVDSQTGKGRQTDGGASTFFDDSFSSTSSH